MEKALQNVTRLLKTKDPSWRSGLEIAFWRSCFEVLGQMTGSAVKFHEIADESDKEQLLDTLAEVKFAVIFSELGFSVEVEPLRKESLGANPDLRISKNGYNSLVEVKRFRPSRNPVPELSNTASVLSKYGDPQRDWQNIFDKINDKFRQVGNDGIIAFWNNNDNLEYVDVESAAHAHAIKARSSKSSFLLFRSHLEDENFFCYKLKYSLPAYQKIWMSELEQVNPKQVLFGPYSRSQT